MDMKKYERQAGDEVVTFEGKVHGASYSSSFIKFERLNNCAYANYS